MFHLGLAPFRKISSFNLIYISWLTLFLCFILKWLKHTCIAHLEHCSYLNSIPLTINKTALSSTISCSIWWYSPNIEIAIANLLGMTNKYLDCSIFIINSLIYPQNKNWCTKTNHWPWKKQTSQPPQCHKTHVE